MQSQAKTVAAYLKELEPEKRKVIAKLRQIIKAAVPQAKEMMNYGMPSYDWGGPLIGFASQKNNFALYICDIDLGKILAKELPAKTSCGKGCWRFRHLADIPEPLLARVLQLAIEARQAKLDADQSSLNSFDSQMQFYP